MTKRIARFERLLDLLSCGLSMVYATYLALSPFSWLLIVKLLLASIVLTVVEVTILAVYVSVVTKGGYWDWLENRHTIGEPKKKNN